jgi:hypothetical protein
MAPLWLMGKFFEGVELEDRWKGVEKGGWPPAVSTYLGI